MGIRWKLEGDKETGKGGRGEHPLSASDTHTFSGKGCSPVKAGLTLGSRCLPVAVPLPRPSLPQLPHSRSAFVVSCRALIMCQVLGCVTPTNKENGCLASKADILVRGDSRKQADKNCARWR